MKSNSKEYISEQNKRARKSRISKPINDKERLIIRMVCNQFSNKEIADVLGISKRTAETSRQIIIKKIGCKNSIGMVTYAIKNKIYDV